MGIIVESLPSSVIDDELRNRLRIFTVVLSLPEVAKALKDVGKGLIKELRATKAGTNVVEEQRDIEKLATALEKGLGEAEIFIDYKKLGVSKLVDLTGFKALDDEFIDIVIHFKNGKFVAQVEKEGAFVEQVVEMTEMAALINRLPAGKSVRLLSCNDLASARELSQQIGNRALYASDGWVDLYADGAVRSQNAFKKLENGEELGEIAMDNTGGVGSKVRLGEELANGAEKWLDDLPAGLKSDIGDVNSNFGKLFANATDARRAELVDAWKKLDDLGADDALRRNPEALDYLAKGRSDKILLDVEELLGGHSKARHGSHIPMSEMEQRALGTHPTMPQSRSALKFSTDAIHEASVNKAFKEHKPEIEAHFASGGGYKEWDSQLSGPIGEGYYNSGTRSSPILNQVSTDKVKIAFDVDPNSPSGYKMISAYPWYEIS